MSCGVKVLFVLLVLAFAGTSCQKENTRGTSVTFSKSVGGDIYFQPEEKDGYEKVVPDSLGNLVLKIELKEPGYYRYVSTKQFFYSVYLTPGSRVEIVENEDGVFFKGDHAAENAFLAENPFVGEAEEGVEKYSAEWVSANWQGLERMIGKLRESGLPREFIQLQELKYRFGVYKQLLEGPALMAMFMNRTVRLPDDYYDFLKDLKFDDPQITRVPKWFQVMVGAFERMEKEGMLEVSLEHFMEVYGKRIEDEKVRSLFLVNLLDLTLQKGYSDQFPAYVMSVRRLITDSVAIAQLPRIEARYREALEANQMIVRGMSAPEFKAVDVNGKEYSSADFKGKVQVLDFWFTGCVPCRAEMPYMEKLADELEGQPIVFVAMSLDSGNELLATWRQMVKDKKGNEYHLNVPDGFKSALAKSYLIRGVPRVVVIDKEGKIVDAYAKRPSDPKLKMQLEQLIERL
ncbi:MULTISPECIES: TlpA family protein disulfide reductase [Butyricimonas]|uniref:TlpA family protein disulfide reductase n=1 Tax=Butyricimonas TaxID=574697 RepID=UPI0007FB4945|nr:MULTISPECIES: TlpA disulfide reductase family protein [Butyricimonas]